VSARLVFRNALEFAAIFALWAGVLQVLRTGGLSVAAATAVTLVLCWAKTIFFGVENIRQLRLASEQNTPYHRFMVLMMVNMWQIAASFALDFHLLDVIAPQSFAVVKEDLAGPALVFEFFYFSSLNFMFFGYGDVTPQTVPAKLMTLTEIALAFVTVIFLLSDFISLKESLRKRPDGPTQSADGKHSRAEG
jgi:hypothetical protein